MNQDELLTERQNEGESDKQNYRNAERQKDKSQKDKEMERRMEGIQFLMMMIIRAVEGEGGDGIPMKQMQMEGD